MSILSISGVNQSFGMGMQTRQVTRPAEEGKPVPVVSIKSDLVQDNDNNSELDNKKGISKKNTIIGASAALATIVVGGILFNKHLRINQLTSEIEKVRKSLNKTVQFQREDDAFCKVFDPEILQKYIDNVTKLGKKEQLTRLNKIEDILSDDRGLVLGLTSDMKSFRLDTSKLPKEVQDTIAAKDQLKATEAYKKYCDTLFNKSKTAGATVEESVMNVFGKDTKIKPHTYDVSKEADRIATAQYGKNGFTDVTVTSDNMLVDTLNRKNTICLYPRMLRPAAGENARIVSGMRDGKPVVSICYMDRRRPDAPNAIELLSPNKELTPAQIDLLKLKDKAAQLDVSELKFATLGGDKTNFDAILSAIQTLASGK